MTGVNAPESRGGDNEVMSFLLRVELPDVPGSLGSLATALGEAGADIEVIEVVEHRADGFAIDDVILELPKTLMPDTLITACHALPGVRVHWIQRYDAGLNLSMDVEAIEVFTDDPRHAVQLLVDVIPSTFRTDWAMALTSADGSVRVLRQSPNAPEVGEEALTWLTLKRAATIDPPDSQASMVLAAAPGHPESGEGFVLVTGRHGGPEFLASEVARLGHIVALAASVQLGTGSHRA